MGTSTSVESTKQQQQQQGKILRTSKKENLPQENINKEEEDCFQYTKNLPLVERKHIRIGSCLGKGSFSKVYKIRNKRRLDNLLSSSSSSTDKMKKNLPTPSPSIKNRSPLFFALSSLVKQPSNNNKVKKKYAVKFLRNNIMKKEEKYVLDAKLDMKKEIQALSLLKHENIINIYGYGCYSSPEDLPFLIIEQIESTLQERIDDWQYLQYNTNTGSDYFDWNKSINCGSMLINEKISIALQIMNAIKYMHDCGFVYRDLKPQNTGLLHSLDSTRGTKVKLFDFGTCRKLPKDNNKNQNKAKDECIKMTIVGSLRYMAPELHAFRKYNEKVDMYSWAILVYETLTLLKAYPIYSRAEYYQKIHQNNERPQFFDDFINDDLSVPKEIQDILRHSWEGDISKRYSSKDAQERLQSYCDKHSILLPNEQEIEDDFMMET